MKNSKNTQYVALLVEDKGVFRVKMAKRLNPVNQFTRHWKRISARSLARRINKSKFVIK